MADDFDLDGLLDDVLNNTIQQNENGNTTSSQLTAPQFTPVQPSSKYQALQVLPISMEREWERVIEVDEAVMKLRKPHNLSNAYMETTGSIHEKSLKEYFEMIVGGVIGTDSGLLTSLSSNSMVLRLFREELVKRIRESVSTDDKDLIAGNFKALKSLLCL